MTTTTATGTVRVSRSAYLRCRNDDGSKRYDYEAYCLRCNREVRSNEGRVGVVSNRCWSTKAPAMRAAREHLERHRRADEAGYARPGELRDGWELVEDVTL